MLSDGTILDLFWTYDTKASVYLDVHACCSMDNGKTWSKMWNTAISGQPAQPISLPDGRTVMVYVDRTEGVTISAVSSADRGRSWPGQDHCVIYSLSGEIQTGQKKGMEDAWSEMAAFSVGLPATAALADGNVLVVYYAGEHQDRTDIRWARLSG